jgi:N-formylglutamate amidohydrolase
MRAIAAILRRCLTLSCAQYGEGEVDEVHYCSNQLFKTGKGESEVQTLEDTRVSLNIAPSRPNPIRLCHPQLAASGVIVACPHSGRFYPPELLSASVLDQFTLRRSEDAFVDLLFRDAPSHGALLIINEFARAYVDVNRSPGELDPKLVDDVLPSDLEANSDRVKAGLGVVPRTVGEGVQIYNRRISREEAQSRITEIHEPWHRELEECLRRTITYEGVVLLLDCHSMPSNAAGELSYDVVLGDRFGESCAPIIMNEAIDHLKAAGLNIGRNDPYAGGYTTRRHGMVHYRQNVLQIEINRSLYMVEGALTLRPSFAAVRKTMSEFVGHLAHVTRQLGIKTEG